MVARSQWFVLIVVMCAVFAFAASVHAQFGLPGEGNALTIAFSPTSPSPGDTLSLTVQSNLLDIAESTVVWQANGKTIAQGKGMRSASVKVGALGDETRIAVTLTASDGATASGQARVIPTELDLLVDSDSYVPPFYSGRPLPSVGSNLHLQALPRFRQGGVAVSASTLTYTWRRNDEVLGSISGLGRSTAVIPVLHLFGTDTISVEARSVDGILSHTSSFSLSASEPLLSLYEDHPLYGVLYHRGLSASTFVPETEMTFSAVPFFAQANSAKDPALNFIWHVNGADIPTSATDPNELTINAENSSGIALVQLEVTHRSNFYLDMKNVWDITFSSGEALIDQFHNSSQ